MAKLRKAGKLSKPDLMSKRQDEQLENLEEHLTALYSLAAKDIQKQLQAFLNGKKKKDDALRKSYEDEEISKQEYEEARVALFTGGKDYKAILEKITGALVLTDVVAMTTVSSVIPYAAAQSFSYSLYMGEAMSSAVGVALAPIAIKYGSEIFASLSKLPEKLSDFYWSIKDRIRNRDVSYEAFNINRDVLKYLTKRPDILPRVNLPKDELWNRRKINDAIRQGIIRGESIPDIASRLRAVTDMDATAAIRNARTAMTAAENASRDVAIHKLIDAGAPLVIVWSATHDNRTRETHLLLDGTTQDKDGYFGVGIIDTPLRYPSDPEGDGEEIYNCRCRISGQFTPEYIDHSNDSELYAKMMSEGQFEDWVSEKAEEYE